MKLDTLKILYDLICKYDADIVQCNFQRVNEDGNLIFSNNDEFDENIIYVYTRDEAFKAVNKPHEITTISCGKLFKSNIFKNLRYPKCRIHEDEYLIHHVIGNANKVIVTGKKLYMYSQRNNSLMGNIKTKFYEWRYNDAFGAYLDRYKYFKQINNPEMLEDTRILIYSFTLGMIGGGSYIKHKKFFDEKIKLTLELLKESQKFKSRLRPLKIYYYLLKNIVKHFLHRFPMDQY